MRNITPLKHNNFFVDALTNWLSKRMIGGFPDMENVSFRILASPKVICLLSLLYIASDTAPTLVWPASDMPTPGRPG